MLRIFCSLYSYGKYTDSLNQHLTTLLLSPCHIALGNKSVYSVLSQAQPVICHFWYRSYSSLWTKLPSYKATTLNIILLVLILPLFIFDIQLSFFNIFEFSPLSWHIINCDFFLHLFTMRLTSSISAINLIQDIFITIL